MSVVGFLRLRPFATTSYSLFQLSDYAMKFFYQFLTFKKDAECQTSVLRYRNHNSKKIYSKIYHQQEKGFRN